MIDFISNLFGGKNACGTITTGGTESILLAMLCYREIARELGIWNPEILTDESIHPAFDKAAYYFNIKLKKIKL